MKKSVILITHERSGTHLVINLINYEKFGKFYSVGYIEDQNRHTIEDYKHVVYRDIMSYAYLENCVLKSHHQIEFVADYLDYLFDKYHVIYVQRNMLDVLNSYYKFIKRASKHNFPNIGEWIFSNPNDIGKKFLYPYSPDPHILIEPKNYIDRYMLHLNGWMEYKKHMLVLSYEDILTNYSNQKQLIENYISRKIADIIPDVHDKRFPNFGLVQGIIGGHKENMNAELISKIDDYIKSNYS